MNLFRFILGAPIAALMTLIVFGAMAALIRQDFVEPEPQMSDEVRPVTPQIVETEVGPIDTTPPTIDVPHPPPPNQIDPSERSDGNNTPVHIPTVEVRWVLSSSALSPIEEPIVRATPYYPEHCIADQNPIETVILETDIDPNGNVTNGKVIESSNSCFDHAAIVAVKRWKYAPELVNGEAIWRRGVRAEITFELAEEESRPLE